VFKEEAVMVSEIKVHNSPQPAPAEVHRAPVTMPKSNAAPQPMSKPDVQVDTQQMKQNLDAAIDRLNAQMKESSRGLNFSMDEKLGRPVVTVRNESTGEVVRQIPNEVVVRVAHNIDQLKGLLHNEKT
jgi:flagellar protein FlaG